MEKKLFVGIDTSKEGHQVSLMNPTNIKVDQPEQKEKPKPEKEPKSAKKSFY